MRYLQSEFGPVKSTDPPPPNGASSAYFDNVSSRAAAFEPPARHIPSRESSLSLLSADEEPSLSGYGITMINSPTSRKRKRDNKSIADDTDDAEEEPDIDEEDVKDDDEDWEDQEFTLEEIDELDTDTEDPPHKRHRGDVRYLS